MYIIDADTTIKDLELRLGIEYEPQEVKGSALSIWYDMLRHKRIQELSDEDMTRLIRQNLYIPYIMPEVLARLKNNPTMGELYSGEMMEALSKLDNGFWSTQLDAVNKLLFLTENIINNKTEIDYEWLYSEEECEFLNRVEKLREVLLKK